MDHLIKYANEHSIYKVIIWFVKFFSFPFISAIQNVFLISILTYYFLTFLYIFCGLVCVRQTDTPVCVCGVKIDHIWV